MKELEQAHEEYIQFLENEIGNVSPLLIIHGWVCPKEVVEKGNELRLKISKLREKTK